MFNVARGAHTVRTMLFAAASAAVPLAFATLMSSHAVAQAITHEITVTISRVKAVDKMDVFSKADFFARVTIAGEALSTPAVRQQDDIRPNWKIVKRVAAGEHKIKLEILDKDATKTDPVDVNKLDAKRDLDFTVNTRSSRVAGFASTYRTGATISRAGRERKAAEVTFTVEVKKL